LVATATAALSFMATTFFPSGATEERLHRLHCGATILYDALFEIIRGDIESVRPSHMSYSILQSQQIDLSLANSTPPSIEEVPDGEGSDSN